MSAGAEIRQAIRGLRQTPVVSGAAVLCLALGLGATTAIYSAVYTALLEPLPFDRPDQLVTVYRTTPNFDTGPFSPANYLDLRSETTSLSSLIAIGRATWLLQGPDETMRVSVLRASGNVFAAIGTRPVRGRLFSDADDAEGATPVVVLAESFWRARFGADPAFIGSTVRLDGEVFEVIGVAPESFRIPHGNQALGADVWVPMRFSANEAATRGSNYLLVMGRLRDNASVAAADAELKQIMDRIVEVNPDLVGEQLRVVPMHAESVHAVREPLLMLLGAVGFVLLIASANVASLLLARGVGRRREIAVRAALGARRWDVLRPALLEAAVLTAAGAVAGLALAWAGVRLIRALLPAQLPQLADLGVDWAVLAFSFAIAATVALVSGVVPAWQAARSDPQDALASSQRSGTSRTQHALLRTIVAVEVALSLVLLLGAGLLLRGFERLVSRDPGFEPASLLAFTVSVPPDSYADRSTADAFLIPALDAVRAVPGVVDAGATMLIPYDNWGWNFNILYEGRPAEPRTQQPLTETRTVTPGYFTTLERRLLRGRLLDDRDRDGAPYAVVVNQALADRDFPGEDPIGKRFHLSDTVFATIVGVVSNIRNVGPDREAHPGVYYRYGQSQRGSTSFPILARVRGDPAQYATAVSRAVHSVDPNAAVSRMQRMTDVIAASMGRPRFYLSLLGSFAAVALLLSLAGLYGVMSYVVAQRTREIGIRTALGSTPRRTLGLVMRQGMLLVGAGIALGLCGGFALTRLLGTALYGVSPLDALTWFSVALLLVVAAAVAILFPARCAATVDPIVAMRVD
jgi:predicted permease